VGTSKRENGGREGWNSPLGVKSVKALIRKETGGKDLSKKCLGCNAKVAKEGNKTGRNIEGGGRKSQTNRWGEKKNHAS